MTVWGKYRFVQGSVSFSAGGFIVLPTGSEDDGLGTGNMVPGAFGGVRVTAGPGFFVGDLTLRFNQDADILDTHVDAKTSTAFAGGYMWLPWHDWAFSGELSVESERFSNSDSDFRVTAGAQFVGIKHSRLRGALGVGLTDGAPTYELILGYAYAF